MKLKDWPKKGLDVAQPGGQYSLTACFTSKSRVGQLN